MEIHFGEFEGADLADNSAHPFFLKWTADPFDTAAPGGESFRQLRDRTRDWFLEAATLDANHIVVFSHSGAIQMILAELLGIERPSYQRRLSLANTGVTRVSYTAHGDDVQAVIECVNDTRHLRPEDVR